MKKVLFLTHAVHFYRRPFHDQVRSKLASHNVNYVVAQGGAGQHDTTKEDTLVLPWAISRPTRMIKIWGARLFWQPFLREALNADLIVLPQENKYILNYLIQVGRNTRLFKAAFWGHGRNFQSRNVNSAGERWKRFWATKVDWWFGYTEETRQHVESLGFPADRITVFNNSVDTTELRRHLAAVTLERLNILRVEMGIVGSNVGVFVGGIYPDKRMSFLVEAADHVRAKISNFELVVIGAGPDLPIVHALAETRPWMHVTGPRFGQDKVELMRLGHVFMMPGLMGLAILDAGVMGLPIATTAFPWHSPEIAYLDPEHNGVKVGEWESPVAYGDAVAELLLDVDRQKGTGRAAREMADRFSIEAMAENFAQGILKALER